MIHRRSDMCRCLGCLSFNHSTNSHLRSLNLMMFSLKGHLFIRTVELNWKHFWIVYSSHYLWIFTQQDYRSSNKSGKKLLDVMWWSALVVMVKQLRNTVDTYNTILPTLCPYCTVWTGFQMYYCLAYVHKFWGTGYFLSLSRTPAKMWQAS